MSNPNPNPKYQFKPGNKAACVNKGNVQVKTIIRENIKDWSRVEELIERNILEFLNSADEKTRRWATQYLSEFGKAKKREVTATVKHEAVKFDLSQLRPDDLVQLSNMLKRIQKPVEENAEANK